MPNPVSTEPVNSPIVFFAKLRSRGFRYLDTRPAPLAIVPWTKFCPVYWKACFIVLAPVLMPSSETIPKDKTFVAALNVALYAISPQSFSSPFTASSATLAIAPPAAAIATPANPPVAIDKSTDNPATAPVAAPIHIPAQTFLPSRAALMPPDIAPKIASVIVLQKSPLSKYTY